MSASKQPIFPDRFLMLTHEGIARVQITSEPVYNIDALIARFGSDKQLTFTRIADHPYGTIHLAIRTNSPWRMPVLELTKGFMVLSTQYHPVKHEDKSWVSPCFAQENSSFPLRCRFEFEKWAEAGLKMFLALNTRAFYLWVYYDGQIYRPPFGNVFDSCQICLGHNEGLLNKALDSKQTDGLAFTKAIQLLSDSDWNSDVLPAKAKTVLPKLVRFDSENHDLPMLAPLEPHLIKHMPVAADKVFADVTAQIILN
jgi:hypothetical protein